MTLEQAVNNVAVAMLRRTNSSSEYTWMREQAIKELHSTDFSIIPLTEVYVEQVFERYLGEYRRANTATCFHRWEQRPSFTELYWACKYCGEPRDKKESV